MTGSSEETDKYIDTEYITLLDAGLLLDFARTFSVVFLAEAVEARFCLATRRLFEAL